MKRSSFRTAQRRVKMPVRRLGTGLIMLGLALTASAKDATTPGPEQLSGAKPAAKATTVAKTSVKTDPKKKHWYEIGVASWYGLQFQGRKTAAGENFDRNGMTCAHPSLPMGTWLRVTNLKNSRTTFVRVNDRGPVLEGRIVDLSQAAARAVGLVGIGRVKLEQVREGDQELAQALMAQVQLPLLFEQMGR